MSDNIIADIVTAQITATHRTSNMLTDMAWSEAIDWAWSEAIDWAQAYANLFDAVERVNDSVKISWIPDHRGHLRDSVERQVEHYEAMKMGDV